MSDQYLGEIRMFGGNFAPLGFALCNGQLLPVSQNTALFSLIGTYYGGNGITTFALPDLRSRVPVHQGNGAGLSPYVVGESIGVENVNLSMQQLPQHNHALNAYSGPGTQAGASGNYWAEGGASRGEKVYAGATDGTLMSPSAFGQTGGNQPHSNIQPYLVVNFIIALTGIYPARN